MYPAVIVHGLDHALAALAPGLDVTLLSAPYAGVYAGVGWWQGLVRAARDAAPDAKFTDMLDCGDAPGRALEALGAGQAALILDCRDDVWRDIAARAAGQGARVWRAPPAAIDLARPGALRLLGRHLGANQE
jgi:hypothetical protein